MTSLQWGGRFTSAPDASLLAFGSSLVDDLVLAAFDVLTSHAHVDALAGGGIIDTTRAAALHAAIARVGQEIENGQFAAYAQSSGAEDVHGAIDARVRELEPEHGAFLHAGRSRNDQVATTLALYARARAEDAAARCRSIARSLLERASNELEAGTRLCATTHWQPAQPVLLAFWLVAAAEPFARGAKRFSAAAESASECCPLGSSALAGSSLPLDRQAAATRLEFARPSRNAMDAVGTRDAALDVAHAYVRACVDASRIAEELVIWATPAFGYVKLGDASSTGSSLMPQKRNPDIFELTRGVASAQIGTYAGALSSLTGMALSYHRDLQETKRQIVDGIERAARALAAFERALADTTFVRDACNAHAADGYAVATDMADALIAQGTSARDAHAQIGALVRRAEEAGEPLDLSARASVEGKVTYGSTSPAAVRAAIASLVDELESFDKLRMTRS
ncbi:MAG TPA: argininosuccinate lyase [Candidatus Baltobacteraceae bacterium]|nr:argininosuccinate lyase [Candidatus Baltobacteraceae bacterium]